MTKRLNEGFQPEDGHRCATSPDEFNMAAEILEAGGSFQQAIEVLTPQHLTSLFHVEKRPPQAMLLDHKREDQIKILRAEAAKIEGES